MKRWSNTLSLGLLLTMGACTLNSPMPSRAPVSDSRAPASMAAPTATAKPAAVTVGANQYQVQKGDTLYSIGKKLGIPFQKLAEANQLQTPYAIHVGQVLNTGNTQQTAAVKTGSDDAEVITSAISQPGMANETPATPANSKALTVENVTVKPAADPAKPATATNDIEAIADTAIQWQWPLRGKISAGFDAQSNKGLNIAGSPGQSIAAAAAGKVIYSGMDIRGYGRLIIIKHNNNLLSVYAHQGASLVKEGVYVVQGDNIASLQTSGNPPATLHFEIRQKGKPVDPAAYLPAGTGNS